MKKYLLILLTVLLGLGSWQASAQETLTVHDGTATNGYVPVYGFYADAYLKAEFVMPAEELYDMIGGQITGMKFYSSTPSVSWGTANFQVFMTEVQETTVNTFTDPNSATTVYTGSLSIAANGEMNITFTTPYAYLGGNLLIGIYNTTPEVVAAGSAVLLLIGFAQPVQAEQFIISGGLRGAGDTRFSAMVTTFTVIVVRSGLAVFTIRYLNMGLWGAWIAMLSDQILRTVLMYYRYSTGKWAHMALTHAMEREALHPEES